MQRMSKGFYLGSYIGGLISIWVLVIIAIFIWPLFLVVIPLAVYVFVVNLIFLYKAWEAIQDGHARTGPCKAIGFLFIPFFNLYWLFQAYWGFAKDYNYYISRHGITAARRLPDGLFLAYCILILLSWLPFVALANFIIYAVIISNICDGVNRLPSLSTASPSSEA